MNLIRAALLGMTFTIASVQMHDADSAEIFTAPNTSAVANCQPALPAFDGLIRKRPRALQNEGGSSAFVSCSFTGDVFSIDGRTVQASAVLTNNTSSMMSVTCTLINGEFTVPNYLPKTLAIASGGFTQFSWSAVDNGGNNLTPFVSMSCSLPPGIGISNIFSSYLMSVDE